MKRLTQPRNRVMETFFTYDLVAKASKAGVDLPWGDIEPRSCNEFQREISRLVGVNVAVSKVTNSKDLGKLPFILVQLA